MPGLLTLGFIEAIPSVEETPPVDLSSATANDLELQVMRLIGENVESPDVFVYSESGIAPIRAWVNDAIEEMCMVTGQYRRRYHLYLEADTFLYQLDPANDYISHIISVFDPENRYPLEKTDIVSLLKNDPWAIRHNGTQTHWWQVGDWFGVHRSPGSAGKILMLDCLAIPKPYVNENEPIDLRKQWRMGTVYRAVSDYHASRHDAARAQEYYLKYLETIGQMGLSPLQRERFWQYGDKRPQQ